MLDIEEKKQQQQSSQSWPTQTEPTNKLKICFAFSFWWRN